MLYKKLFNDLAETIAEQSSFVRQKDKLET